MTMRLRAFGLIVLMVAAAGLAAVTDSSAQADGRPELRIRLQFAANRRPEESQSPYPQTPKGLTLASHRVQDVVFVAYH